MKRLLSVLLLVAAPMLAQEIQWPASFEALAAKAKESVNVTLDSSVLGFASGFLSGDKADEAKVKEYMTPFGQVGSVEVWPASTCEQVVERAQC